MTDDNFRPTWKNRRRVIFGSLIFCALTVGYVLWKGEDTKIGETAITMAFIMASSVVGGYVFGASWENIGVNRSRGGSSGGPSGRSRSDNRGKDDEL